MTRLPSALPLRPHRTTPIARAIAAVCFALLGACNEQPQGTGDPARGSLQVNVSGLGAAQSAAIAVSGPQNFARALTAAATLDGLMPGSYAVTASAVTGGATTFTPAPFAQEVTVVAGETATASVVYAPSAVALTTQLVVQELANPVYLTAPANDARLFVAEQPGRIRIIRNGALVATPFLDITARVTFGGERGLLSMAFDPAYAANGRFYVYYTGAGGDIVVDRHVVSGNPDVADPVFQRVITIPHREASNHNGGLVMFGPDGMLYLGTGDGGGGGDPQNNGQNTSSLLGKLLRLDVSTLPYTIPAGNPFVNVAGADEIWAYGLRNPWRFAFDGTGPSATLYIADVGQNALEEVNAVSASMPGVNYGWRTMEGTRCFSPSTGCNMQGLRLPVHEYNHGAGCSITGGFVYRGTAIPGVQGHYFYSDYCSSGLRSFVLAGGVAGGHRDWMIGNIGNVSSFGRDAAGELYLLTSNGGVHRIVRAP